MAKERLFFTGSTRIIADPRPSGLDMRVYACVSMHDGMSLKKGTGCGCYATFATLTAEICCDMSNLSKSLKRLVEWGYLVEERQDDRRRKTYRVVFDSAEGWRNRQQSKVGETANEPAEIVGNGGSGNGGKPPLTDQHYSSLKGLDTPEGEELDSDNQRTFKNGARLGKIMFDDNVGAKLAKFERDWKASPEDFTDEQLVEWHGWLEELSADSDPSCPDNQRAQRLYYTVDADLYDANRGPYAAGKAA